MGHNQQSRGKRGWTLLNSAASTELFAAKTGAFSNDHLKSPPAIDVTNKNDLLNEQNCDTLKIDHRVDCASHQHIYSFFFINSAS